MTDKTERIYGKVRAYNNFKGYGFIRKTKGKDVFFLYEDVIDKDSNIYEGDTVSFIQEIAPKGPRAKAVKKEG